ncbi:MAG TPA: DegT/DnrJ/EryC1/StrS family aminotransferase [Myxococcota bacterium]|nr:DegT/DnrJ/EryC1/StrS family aminotransferase [Myxococcota bacterium]HOH75922.1 DegT/DnrJ/EryC1/StrS family aminotransferase [Myxococcota bacterium]
MKVPLLDPTIQHRNIGADIEAAAIKVLRSGRYILGPAVSELEIALSAYCGVNHAIGVSSGTDALLMALMALGIGPGDEVVTTTYSFFATAGAISRVGAIPRFADIVPGTFNLDPDALEAAITPKTAAVIVVHLFGQCADMDRIDQIARTRGIPVIEDAAQAIGAEWHGRRAGSMGTVGCFSFFPSKNLGAAGDGGLVTTNDEALAERLRRLRNHGSQPRYFHALVGGNFRLDEIQAAILLAKLDHLDTWTSERQMNAATYERLLRPAEEAGMLRLPRAASGSRHVWNQYTLTIPDRRQEVIDRLDAAGIGWAIYYPLCLHLQECFVDLGGRHGDCPQAELTSATALSIPIFPGLSRSQLRYVADAVIGEQSRIDIDAG